MSAGSSAVVPDAPGTRRVREQPTGPGGLWVHPDWLERFPWLVQGTTGRAGGDLDLGLFGEVPTARAQARWRALRWATGMPTAAHAFQVHGAVILRHDHLPPGLFVGDDADGHVTRTPGILLTVSVADCVPIFLVDPRVRVLALLHGGWRGIAAGILEAGLAALVQLGASREHIALHCGPAICGPCYEVGADVPRALGIGVADGKVHLDLRAVIADRARRAGMAESQLSVSGHCTRCGTGFWSHRAGCRERQLGVLGLRPA